MIRDITIRTVLNGYVVQVGCQTVVYNSVDTLLVELRNYLIDPEDAEKRYSQFPNARFTLNGPAQQVAQTERQYVGEGSGAGNARMADDPYISRNATSTRRG